MKYHPEHKKSLASKAIDGIKDDVDYINKMTKPLDYKFNYHNNYNVRGKLECKRIPFTDYYNLNIICAHASQMGERTLGWSSSPFLDGLFHFFNGFRRNLVQFVAYLRVYLEHGHHFFFARCTPDL